MCKKCKYTLPNKTEDIEEPLLGKVRKSTREENSIQKKRYVKMLLTPNNIQHTKKSDESIEKPKLSEEKQHSSNEKLEKQQKPTNNALIEGNTQNTENTSFFSTYLEYIKKEKDDELSESSPASDSLPNKDEKNEPQEEVEEVSLKESSDYSINSLKITEELDSLDSKEESRKEKSDLINGFKITSSLEKDVSNKDVLSSSNIIKALRLLAIPECSISMEGEINLTEEATEITSITNDLSIISCEFVPTRFIPNSYRVSMGKLHVKCVLHKTIEYTSATMQDNDSSIYTKKQQKMDIPYNFCTTVTFPENRYPLLSLMNEQSFKFLNEEKYHNETNRKIVRNKIEYNEPIQFELISAMFHEANNVSDSIKESENKKFRSFHSSFSVDVRIGILQLQKVKIEMDVVECN